MKSKTHFKQMYLVDPIAYNRINNTTTSNPIIIGKPNIQISPPNLNVSAPVTTEIPIPSTYPSTQTSVGTQSNVLHTKSMGSMTESAPTKEHQASQTAQLPQQSVMMNKHEEVNDRNLRINNRAPRFNNPGERNKVQTSRNAALSYPSSAETNQYIAPVNNFHEEIKNVNITPHHSNQVMRSESHPKMMDVDKASPTTRQKGTEEMMMNAKPFEEDEHRWLNKYYYNLEQQNVQHTPQLQFENVPLPIQNINRNTQKYTKDSGTTSSQQPMNIAIEHSSPKALPTPMSVPQLQQPHLINFQSLPKPMNIPIEHSSPKALPAPSSEEDCEECSLTPYKEYGVSLPFPTGLPESVIYMCTICDTKFSSEKSLQRHMKNIHDAFTQVKKGSKRTLEQNKIITKKMKTSHRGIKRKLEQDAISAKKMKTSHMVNPYSLYNLEKLT